MFRIFLFTILVITSFGSCTKEYSLEQKPNEITMFYKLASQDLDGTPSESIVKVVRYTGVISQKSVANLIDSELLSTSSDEGDSDEDDDEDNEDDDENDPLYCLKHPEKKKCQALLPMKMDYFDAVVNNGVVKIIWKTNFEDNLDKFLILKSYDGKNFSIIGTVAPHGPYKQYEFIDDLKK